MNAIMNEINYQKELDKILSCEDNRGKKLFLHSCCAPCSSYCLLYLSSFFDITVFYYNPNITGDSEYQHRVREQIRLIETYNSELGEEIASGKRYAISFIEGDHDTGAFYEVIKGLENEPEGGARCARCFKLRLEETLRKAKPAGADYFGTTLTISPLKNAKVINSIGYALAGERMTGSAESSDSVAPEVMWLPSDFKKKEGYKQSIELSKKYDLYRQNYCGCEFSRNEANT